jgi:hypothetical protein
MNIESFKEVLCKNFRSWFLELAKLAEQTDDNSNLPKLELSLRSGHVIRGSILKVQDNAHEQLLMILGLLDPYTKSEITFISSNEVVALTLLEPEAYLKQLAVPTDHKNVGTLELKRAIKNIESELEKALQFQIKLQIEADTIPEINRWDVLRTIGFLPSLFTQVASDELGKKLVRENIAAISIIPSAANKTSLQEKTLILSVASPLAIPVGKEKERLRKEIESVL